MSRTDVGTHTPESLTTIASALQAIANRLTRTAEAMKEKKVASLEIKNQAALKTGITSVRGFGMAAEAALEEWVFDQDVFKGEVEPGGEQVKVRPGRKPKKEQGAPSGENPMADPQG
jgi:hypothetical protein